MTTPTTTTTGELATAQRLAKVLAELLRHRKDASEKLRELLSGLESLDGFRLSSALHEAARSTEELPSAELAPSPIETASKLVRAYAAADAQSAGLRYAAIVSFLGDEKLHYAQTSDPRAPTELEREMHRHLAVFARELEFDTPDLPREDGILAWDARLARYVARIGKEGPKLAAKIYTNARERMQAYEANPHATRELWRLWLVSDETPVPLFAINLARVLWREVVGPFLHKQPALAYPVHVDVTRVHSRMFRTEERNGQRVLSLDHGVSLAPSVEMDALDGLLGRGIDLLGSVTAHKALRWEVIEGHTRVMRGESDPRRIDIPGGWSALAETLDLSGRKGAESLRAIVYAQAHIRFKLPNGKNGNLLAYEETPAVGRRQGHVTLVLGDTLLPDYVFFLRDQLGDASRSAREAQRLVPMVELPPFVGRPNEHGQQATLSMVVVRDMRERARELVTNGGVLLDLNHFAELARIAGLPTSLLVNVLDRWTRDGDDAPAFLKRTERDRYTLGDAHAASRAFLEEAGRRELEAAESGRRSVAARAKGRARRLRSKK